MPGYFEARPEGGAAIVFDEVEISILRSLSVQLLELIGPGEEPAQDADPLAALMVDGPSEPPADPALARLFPDAYGGPGAPADRATREAAAEFRRYTETDLRAGKRQNLLTVVGSLDGLSAREDEDDVLRLDADLCRQWLGALNDLRLAIGTRLEVSEDDDTLMRLPDSDPRKPMVHAYLWLGGLQETLVESLMA